MTKRDPFAAPNAPAYRRTTRLISIRNDPSVAGPEWKIVEGPTYLTNVRGRVFVIHRDECDHLIVSDLRTGGKVCSGIESLAGTARLAIETIERFIRKRGPEQLAALYENQEKKTGISPSLT